MLSSLQLGGVYRTSDIGLSTALSKLTVSVCDYVSNTSLLVNRNVCTSTRVRTTKKRKKKLPSTLVPGFTALQGAGGQGHPTPDPTVWTETQIGG